MDDNWRRSVGYICIALVLITWIFGAAWIMSPQEFTFKFEIDNNTKEAVESVEYPIIDNSIEKYGPLEECGLIYGNGTMIETDCDVLGRVSE